MRMAQIVLWGWIAVALALYLRQFMDLVPAIFSVIK